MSGSIVIGIGNSIRSDDGVGIHVVRGLEGRVPDNVELIEGTVYCADLLPFLEGRDSAIFIDGIDAGEEPGAIFRFSPEQVKQKRPAEPISLHDFGIYELIAAAELLDQRPPYITIVCVQVKSTDMGEELSDEVAAAVPHACELVLELLGGGSET